MLSLKITVFRIVPVIIPFIILSCLCNSIDDSSLAESSIVSNEIAGCNSLPKQDTLITLNGRNTTIKVIPSEIKKGTFLLLHGWNLPATDWCTKTSLCDTALALGYCVVLPDMGKSNYQTQIFPETKPELRKTPGLYYLTDTLIPFLQQYCLLLKGEKNFIVGLSTGARGVVVTCMKLPGLFTAAAALSGDYDQAYIPNDKVHIGFYGSFPEHRQRWQTIDNPVSMAEKMVTPVYIGHGKNDHIVPFSQSQMFYDTLKKIHPELRIYFHDTVAGHDYSYWESEVDGIIKFFNISNLHCPIKY